MIGFLIGLYRKKWLPLAIVTISVGSLWQPFFAIKSDQKSNHFTPPNSSLET